MNSRDEDNTAWRRALRQDMASRRAALAGAEYQALSARIVAHALATLPRPRVAAFCWPIKHEPDVRPLLASWAGTNVRAALPVVVAEKEALRFREWTPDTRLEPDRYGIPTPTAGEWLTPFGVVRLHTADAKPWADLMGQRLAMQPGHDGRVLRSGCRR